MIQIEELFNSYKFEKDHTMRVSKLAITLFDLLRPQHNLGSTERMLLEAAARIHDIGYHVNSEKHHITGRDILLENRTCQIDRDKQKVLAWIIFFHGDWYSKKKIKRILKNELNTFSQQEKRTILTLGAILRLADGLDYSRAESRITGIVPGKKKIIFEISGSGARIDTKRAEKKSDLWNILFDVQLRFKAEVGTESFEFKDYENIISKYSSEKFSKEDHINKAARKILSHHFEVMLKNEKKAFSGEDIESLHDFRVAGMRLITACEIFGNYFEEDLLRQLAKGLKKIRSILAPVRDLDVLIDDIEKFCNSNNKTGSDEIKKIIDLLNENRQNFLYRMSFYMTSNHYLRFKKNFLEILCNDKFWDKNSVRQNLISHDAIKDILPFIIIKTVNRISSYDRLLQEKGDFSVKELHKIRVLLKKIRYTLEFFNEILNPESKKIIKKIKNVQDYLGNLHDTEIGLSIMKSLIEKSISRTDAGEIKKYYSQRKKTLKTLIDSFPDVWKKFYSKKFKQNIYNLM